jgi:integrase
MRTIHCKGGFVVEIIDDDHWIIPSPKISTCYHLNIDFSRIPGEVRQWWRSLLEASYRALPPTRIVGIWYAVLWLTRYQSEHGTLTTSLDSLDAVYWGNFAEWLKTQRSTFGGRPLSPGTRRGYFGSLLAVAREAITLKIPGVSGITIDRLHVITRYRFKDLVTETSRRIERRALTSDQYTGLYTMMGEEWQRYLDRKKGVQVKADLPTLVACWLVFNDALRSAEINTLRVTDVQVDRLYNKHQLYVHAGNKRPDMIPIDNNTLVLLQELISAGEEARKALKTDLLFVSLHGKPRVLTSKRLNSALRSMLKRYDHLDLPHDLKLTDGRTTLGTHLTRDIHNRERVRHIMRHHWASTTEKFYRAQQKLVVAGNMARALQGEALRLTVACQRPIVDLNERPDQADIIERNPGNAELEWGSCGLDAVRQGSCRRASHCFDCPLLVPWVSKRHNYVAERDEYLRMAAEAKNLRDRENYLYHANQAQAYILLIDRRLEEKKNGIHSSLSTRQRRPRRTVPSQEV